MAEIAVEKTAPHEMTFNDGFSQPSSDAGPVSRPKGWRYRSVKVGSIQLPWYASPPAQLVLVAFVCFLCPGMFNALGGLGGGGQVKANVADKANTALYSTFAVVGQFDDIFSGLWAVTSYAPLSATMCCLSRSRYHTHQQLRL